MDITKVTRLCNRVGMKFVKYAPELLLGGGLLLGGATVVMACRQTKKLDENIGAQKEDLNELRALSEEEKMTVYEGDVRGYQKDLFLGYGRLALGYGKTYWPVVTTGMVSAACILGSYRVLKIRNVALIGAYKALESSYSNYRKKVQETYGEEIDYQFYNGIEKEAVINEKGKRETEYVLDDINSPYSKFFDASCPDWRDSADYNYMFLKAQQDAANDILKTDGHLFLNTVYDMLGIKHTQAGAVVGWVYPNGRDNCVDFGIYRNDPTNPIDANRRFVNGLENSILLDFNVDGIILDKI